MTETAYILLTIFLFIVIVLIFQKKRDKTETIKNIPEGDFQKKAKEMISDKKSKK